CQERGKPMLVHLGAGAHRGDFRRLPERFPRLNVIYAHAGIPWYGTLWDDAVRRENVFVDLSSPYLDKALRHRALRALGASRCLYGSDGPYGYPARDGGYDHGAILRQIEQTGLWAAHVPAEWGGAGVSLTEFAHLSEELGRSPLGHYVFNVQAPDVGNMELLLSHGTAEQKDRWLRPLVRGDIRSCFTMTEPEFAGSNPVWMGTTAVKDGGSWVIRGHKWFSTAADGAAFAVCMAVTNPDAKPHQRASMIIVPTDTPGFELVGNISVMGHKGADHQSHSEVKYHGARVPLSNLLGEEGKGFELAQA